MNEKRTSSYILVLILFTAALYISSLLGSNLAQAATAIGTVSGSVVNVRPTPSTANPQIGVILQGSKVEILAQSGDWYNVKFGSLTGWVRKDFITTGTSSPATNIKPVQQSNSPTVILDGAPLTFDVQPIIENGRILVPMAAIFRAMGAAVTWDSVTQTVTALRGTTAVVLPINSYTPTVNGTVWKLDVPARIVGNRTLAPLRFVGEALGGTVSWDGTNFRAIMTSPPSTSNSNKAVVAVNIISTVNLRSSAELNDSNVIGQANPGETLTVLSQYGDWYMVRKGSVNAWVAGWVVELIREGEQVPPSAETPVVTPEEGTGPNISPVVEPSRGSDLASITLNSDRSAEGLKITMDSSARLDMDISEDSGRITYTFKDSQVSSTTSLEKWLGAQKITVQAANDGDNVQVVITLPTDVKYETSTENSGKRAVFFIPNYISSVTRSSFGSGGENVTVKGIAALGYTSTVGDKKLVIIINNALQGKAQSSYSYSGSIIGSMTFAPKMVDGETATVMTINTNKAAKFSVGLNDDGSALNVLFIAKSEIESREPVVVLDAGHGGKDPGAMGDNLNEKDVNLAVAQKVGELLKAKGIRVVYTRKDDTFVELDDRPSIANMYNASLFVSIHCNSNVNSTPSGTETYCYYPLSDPQLYMQKDERYNLALRIQQAMVDTLGLNDRGVKQANFEVLRETGMPSALVEMAFISNPDEEALLAQSSFRNKAAGAIAAAIADYMKSYS